MVKSKVIMTQLEDEQMTEDQFYQKIISSIKEKNLEIDADSFQPVMKIVLELPLEPITDTDSTIGKQKLYELIGRAICDEGLSVKQEVMEDSDDY